jgi:hypothetical protein
MAVEPDALLSPFFILLIVKLIVWIYCLLLLLVVDVAVCCWLLLLVVTFAVGKTSWQKY